MSEPNPDRDLTQLEGALAGLKPAAPLDRDRLMYRAGQASVPCRGWAWPATTAASLLLSLTLGVMLLNRAAPEEVVRVIPVPIAVPVPGPPSLPTAPSPSAEPSLPVTKANPADAPLEYAQMRKEVLRWGVDALASRPPISAGSRQSSTVGSLMHQIEQ